MREHLQDHVDRRVTSPESDEHPLENQIVNLPDFVMMGDVLAELYYLGRGFDYFLIVD